MPVLRIQDYNQNRGRFSETRKGKIMKGLYGKPNVFLGFLKTFLQKGI